MAKAQVTFLTGANSGTVLVFDQLAYIGPNNECEIRVEHDPDCERKSGRIQLENDKWQLLIDSGAPWFVDMESTMDQRKVKLKSGSIIRLTPMGPDIEFQLGISKSVGIEIAAGPSYMQADTKLVEQQTSQPSLRGEIPKAVLLPPNSAHQSASTSPNEDRSTGLPTGPLNKILIGIALLLVISGLLIHFFRNHKQTAGGSFNASPRELETKEKPKLEKPVASPPSQNPVRQGTQPQDFIGWIGLRTEGKQNSTIPFCSVWAVNETTFVGPVNWLRLLYNAKKENDTNTDTGNSSIVIWVQKENRNWLKTKEIKLHPSVNKNGPQTVSDSRLGIITTRSGNGSEASIVQSPESTRLDQEQWKIIGYPIRNFRGDVNNLQKAKNFDDFDRPELVEFKVQFVRQEIEDKRGKTTVFKVSEVPYGCRGISDLDGFVVLDDAGKVIGLLQSGFVSFAHFAKEIR